MKNAVIETSVRTEQRTDANGSKPTSSLLDLITEGKSAHLASAGGVIIGKFSGFNETGSPLVDFVGDIPHDCVVARSMIALRENQIGFDVVLAFEHGDLARPIITGTLWQPENSLTQEPAVAELEGERITLTAAKEIVLRCGEASITLTKTGKILIRGAYVMSRSSGANRIQGASIQLN
jgi:hypothetical protein